jgi:hypothetical protein
MSDRPLLPGAASWSASGAANDIAKGGDENAYGMVPTKDDFDLLVDRISALADRFSSTIKEV